MPSPSPDQYHPLASQFVVFTGKLSSLARREARDLVVRLGGTTTDDITTRTTMLVIGAEGFGPSAEKSNKLRRAEELNEQLAQPIEIISEEQFCRLAGVPTAIAVGHWSGRKIQRTPYLEAEITLFR